MCGRNPLSAFVPLSPALEWTPDLLQALSDADRKIGQLAGEGHLRHAQLRRESERLLEWLESRAREIIADHGLIAVTLELPSPDHSSQLSLTLRVS
ncbi:MAG: hypothetical protein NTX27_00170 [Verrucomicrobia bacterium]|nr:hypothetical protein [Verrucomicrobiota bacterium]